MIPLATVLTFVFPGMQEELVALQPQLRASSAETEAAMNAIAAETVEADKVKMVVAQEESVASAEAAKVGLSRWCCYPEAKLRNNTGMACFPLKAECAIIAAA